MIPCVQTCKESCNEGSQTHSIYQNIRKKILMECRWRNKIILSLNSSEYGMCIRHSSTHLPLILSPVLLQPLMSKLCVMIVHFLVEVRPMETTHLLLKTHLQPT